MKAAHGTRRTIIQGYSRPISFLFSLSTKTKYRLQMSTIVAVHFIGILLYKLTKW